jgi:hypothetical protein
MCLHPDEELDDFVGRPPDAFQEQLAGQRRAVERATCQGLATAARTRGSNRLHPSGCRFV